MTYNFKKQTKNQFIFFIIFLTLVTLINYLYQINNVKKIYNVSLSLKSKISYEIDELLKPEEGYEVPRRTLMEYYRTLQQKMDQKINYETNYNNNLIEISNNCQKLKIQIQERYYFVNCTTTKPNKSIEVIIKNLSVILGETLEDIELIMIKKTLKKSGLNQNQIKKNNFEIIKKKITSTKNIYRNIILLDVILIFVFSIYIFNINKIKKRFS